MLDETLAARAAEGDEDAFDQLIHRYRAYVYTVAYNILLNEEDALDATQNVFLKLVEKIGGFDPARPFRPWIASITIREALNERRAPRRREIPVEPFEMAELAGDSSSGDGLDARQSAERSIQRALVDEALGELSPQQRAIFTLIFNQGMRPSEAAQSLGVPAKQAGWQLRRALDKIRARLARRGPP